MFKVSRRKIQIVLGLLWLIDGCLQLQSKMFSSKFITSVIDPAKVGQPYFISNPIHFASQIFLSHPVIIDSLIIIIQILIGLLILFKTTTKYGLWFSFLWGIFVWFMGEAAGGIFSGHASLIFGLPGAALIYSIISLAILPKDNSQKEVGGYWLAFIWSAVWIMGAIYQLLPGQNSISSIKMMITSNINGAPNWLANIDRHVSYFLEYLMSNSGAAKIVSSNHTTMMMNSRSDGYGYIVLLSFIMLVIAIGSVMINKKVRNLILVLGIFLTLCFWLIGQGLGGYYTGHMTDLNTGPLIILLGLAIIGQPELSSKLKKIYSKFEKIIV